MKICLDLDGVMVDFVGGAGRLLGYDPGVVDTWDYYHLVGHTESTFWAKVDAAGEGFWANLEPYPWMHQLHQLCKLRGDTIFLTTNSLCPHSAAGKIIWMKKHFGDNFREYLIGPKKEFCAGPDTVLIDDSDVNCAKFRDHGGRAILFPRKWNENRHLADHPFENTIPHLIR